MNFKTAIPLVLAAILGLLAAKVGRDMIVRAKLANERDAKLTKIVVTKADLPAGHALEEGDLILSPVATEARPRTAFGDVKELVGRALIAPMVKGQPVLESFVAPAGSGAGPQALIPRGMRAANIAVNEVTGLPGLILPGCRVDVVSTLQEKERESVARTIVENVKVLAVGTYISVGTGGKREEADLSLAKTVTLLVTPRQAEAIELASNAGRTRLVLRSPLDDSTTSSRGVTVAALLGTERSRAAEFMSRLFPPGGGSAAPVAVSQPARVADPAPATRPADRRMVEVIRNGAVTRVEMELPEEVPPSAVTNTPVEIDGPMQ